MTKFISYGSIGQFRDTVRTCTQWFDHNQLPRGKMLFRGTIKLHGTNAGIAYDPTTKELWAQSRSNILTVEKDNAGFAAYVEKNKALLTVFMEWVQKYLGGEQIKVAFGEWAGGNIQKGVALNGLSKFFTLFDVKVVNETAEDVENGNDSANRYVRSTDLLNLYSPYDDVLADINFHCSEYFKTFQMEIDFSRPEESVQKLIDITMEVERECPVGKFFGVEGVGEGVVWKSDLHPNVRFKSKGEKHSDTKVKTIVAVDVEKIASIREFVSNVLTDHRLEKMLDMLKQQGLEVDAKNTGNFLKLVMNDILKEETETFVASGFVWKDLTGPLSKAARDWYLTATQKVDV
jgi:hypothetical protein